MFISPIMILRYPFASEWIATHIPLVVLKPRVFSAFKRYSELNWVSAAAALTTAGPPMLTYDEMPGSNGEFRGTTDPNTVFLSDEILNRFQLNPLERLDPRMHVLLESTILHEMVHWGDWKDGIDQPAEEGKAFETAAYGADVSRYW